MARLFLPFLLAAALSGPAAAQPPGQNADLIATGSVAAAPPAEERAAIKAAINAYMQGDIAGGDAEAAGIADPVLKTAAEWAAIRGARETLGVARLKRFLAAHPGFPQREFLLRRIENALFVERAASGPVFDFFDGREPRMAAGKLIIALHLRAKGFEEMAAEEVRDAWRMGELSPDVEAKILEAFPDALSEADHTSRALRLAFGGQSGQAIRAARRLSADHAALVEQLSVALRTRGSLQRMIDRVPPSMRSEPAFMLMKATELRRKDRHAEAARLLLSVTRDPARIIDGDEWWEEERALVRGLLDSGEPQLAYRIAAGHRAMDVLDRAEAEFLAGFVALRFLKQPAAADMHFLRSLAAASEPEVKNPAALARAEYWLGRAREELMLPAAPHFETAARIGHSYYGQLAAARIGVKPEIAHRDITDAERAAFARRPEIRVLTTYLKLKQTDLAGPMAMDIAATAENPADIDALGDMLESFGQPRLHLNVGRRALSRGLDVIETAFPVSGVPPFPPVEGGADLPLVLAVARQESAFDPRAVSRADARGLMQMLPSTARVTARRFGIPFTPAALLDDPALNARLGSAHLGELAAATRGNLPMMLAAYNAGPGRMREWIAAYGDPRDPAVDPVDWVERIPFAETRGYIQKVMENHQVYRARLSPGDPRTILDDLAAGRRTLAAALP